VAVYVYIIVEVVGEGLMLVEGGWQDGQSLAPVLSASMSVEQETMTQKVLANAALGTGVGGGHSD
jgi:hypothetical protein